MGGKLSEAGSKLAVGDELAAVLPQDGKPWYKRGYLLKLNFIILSLVLYCKLSYSLHVDTPSLSSGVSIPRSGKSANIRKPIESKMLSNQKLTCASSSIRKRLRRISPEWSPSP
jgi:predicted KAP-like P-loop ATPase